jgi:hypothetical protein
MRKQVLVGTVRAVADLALVFVGCGLQQQRSTILPSVLAERPTSAQPPPAAPQVPPRRYLFPVRGCSVNYGSTHHDYPATDTFTGRGCAFVAVTDGRVDEVSSVDRWDPRTNHGRDRGGRSVSIGGRRQRSSKLR